jgi:hypothetical protein
MIHAGREATELTRPNQDSFAFYLDDQRASQHDETLVTGQVRMRRGIGPYLLRVVVPDLELL